MKKTGLFLLAVLTCFTMTSCKSHNSNVRFGAAALGGMYYSFGNTFTQLAGDNIEGYNFSMKTTAGSAANIRLLSEGYLELAIGQADMIYDAYNGEGIFEGKKYTHYTPIATLYTEACQIVVRDDSSIYTVDDLQDKNVNVGEKESGTLKNANDILMACGLNQNIVTLTNDDYTSAANKLVSGDIDAMFCTAGVQTTIIEELAKKTSIRLIELDDATLERLISSYDYYSKYTIPAGTYEGQTKDVSTIGVKAVLLSNDKMSSDFNDKIYNFLIASKDALQYSLSVDINIEKIN